ncbi:hypothetical protein PoB_002247400 [Plakobranchus ocellatus]|uniref:DUF7869 domain-containing protein n=1 Tax=Plakobranchus ocellatus TaxID=259542 RepID=A0AAV3ZKY0_9GAST|nr:hypothetical protein PoB_002247400 [Plakobranchus ocellatus]
MADADRRPEVTETPKKRPKLGRKWEIERIQRLSSHVAGLPCNCVRFRCFEVTTEDERRALLAHLNGLGSKNEQDSMLSGLIQIKPIQRRRPRQEENEAQLHDYTYTYLVNIVREARAVPIPVCLNAFLSIFGIYNESQSGEDQGCHGKKRQGIKTKFASVPPTDLRGKHNNRPKAFSDDQKQRIIDHIRSFRGRQSHYALKDSRRLYLPEELNGFAITCSYLPKFSCKISDRKIFLEKFNISFGYPRKDTCSTCDALRVQLSSNTASVEELVQLNQERELHLRKARVFYDRKTAARQAAQADTTIAAIAFDFAKNLSCPNVSTSDVYYRRQLSLHTFNVHSLANDSVTLYAYDETIGKKGADDVCSMLHHYFNSVVPAEVKTLELFCDSCAGQNKNWTVIRYLHFMVAHQQRFDKIKITFPIRGHSYMECDRDMALINQKAHVETPDGWIREFEAARKNPSPFNVVQVEQALFLGLTEHLKVLYRATCQVPTRPMREISFSQDHPRLISFRNSWNGPLNTSVVSKPVGKKGAARQPPLIPMYRDRLPISLAKFKDLQVLKTFCTQPAQDFFENLPHIGEAREEYDTTSELSSEGED